MSEGAIFPLFAILVRGGCCIPEDPCARRSPFRRACVYTLLETTLLEACAFVHNTLDISLGQFAKIAPVCHSGVLAGYGFTSLFEVYQKCINTLLATEAAIIQGNEFPGFELFVDHVIFLLTALASSGLMAARYREYACILYPVLVACVGCTTLRVHLPLRDVLFLYSLLFH